MPNYAANYVRSLEKPIIQYMDTMPVFTSILDDSVGSNLSITVNVRKSDFSFFGHLLEIW